MFSEDFHNAHKINAVQEVLRTLSKAEVETIGQRLARLRKERGITQVELADKLGVSQPIISDYERGELRLHGELIVQVSEILGTTADEILGLRSSTGKAKHPNRRILRRLEQIEDLPKRKQDALVQTIDAFLKASEA